MRVECSLDLRSLRPRSCATSFNGSTRSRPKAVDSYDWSRPSATSRGCAFVWASVLPDGNTPSDGTTRTPSSSEYAVARCTWSSSTDGVHESNAASAGRADPTAGSPTSTDECHAYASIAACKCECCQCAYCSSCSFIVDESYTWRRPLSSTCECIDSCGHGSRLWCTKQESRGLHSTVASAELCVHDEQTC